MEAARDQAEFNSALEYLKRINEFFSLCAEAKISLNSYMWANSLSCLFAELSTQMKEDEINKYSVELRRILTITNGSSRVRGGFPIRIDTKLYWDLYNFELFIRKVYRNSGLEMKVKADASNILFKGGV